MIYIQQAIPGSNEPSVIYGEGLVALSGKVFLTTLIQVADHADIDRRLQHRANLSADSGSPAPSPQTDTPHSAPESASP